MRSSSWTLLFVCFALASLDRVVGVDEKEIKEECEGYFQKQSQGLVGKRFKEAVSCKKFYAHIEGMHPDWMSQSANKLNLMSMCKKQIQVERDRRDLQVKCFADEEETSLTACKEFAEDFVGEYGSFKGEIGEAEAYCYFFKEEGSLKSLRQARPKP
ncbi:hypothetical protein T484DRAFT_1917066 [Baffinella frigidus]|nr:hypothetical protein T484DRAFT_1917066 [Cryptophyta sp. CCMP2293]